MSNDPRFLCGIVPSANVIATANEFSRFYQLLLEGGTLDGVRVFDPRTIRRAISEQSYLELDLTLALPFRYGMGFMLGDGWLSPYGPDTPRAFGHIGFTNVIGWADPERQVTAALLTSGKPVISSHVVRVFQLLIELSRLPESPWSRDYVPPVARRRKKRRGGCPLAARRGGRGPPRDAPGEASTSVAVRSLPWRSSPDARSCAPGPRGSSQAPEPARRDGARRASSRRSAPVPARCSESSRAT